MMKALQWFKAAMESNKPLLVMVLIQFIYTGQGLFSKAAVTEGMNPPVFVAYRQAIATLVLAPFAFFCESNMAAYPLTFKVLCRIFIASLFGITAALTLALYALKHISATFHTAMNSTATVIVFIMAVSLRIETLNMKQRDGIGKAIGTVISIAGAMVMTFYKGPALYADRGREITSHPGKSYTSQELIKGSLLMLAANSAWASWLLMQAPVLKVYPSKLRITTLQCFFSCVISAVVGVAMDRNIESWKLGWDVNLISVAYCGIVVTGLSYWLQVWVVDKKGPLYTSIFSPLALVLTAIFSAIIFRETLHWGSVLGSVILVAGLYSFLWGKNEETKMVRPNGIGEGNSNKTINGKEEVQLDRIICASNNDEVLAANQRNREQENEIK